MEDRITELEIRLTHLEETLEIYDAAIIKQNRCRGRFVPSEQKRSCR